jgi:inosose dehydratase
MREGIDPAESVKKFANRLLDVHIKDVTEATANGRNVEVGRGVIDIPALLKTLLEIKYASVAAFEYGKDEDDPLPGLAESVGYIRGVLVML